jgi:hypothetical protein
MEQRDEVGRMKVKKETDYVTCSMPLQCGSTKEISTVVRKYLNKACK